MEFDENLSEAAPQAPTAISLNTDKGIGEQLRYQIGRPVELITKPGVIIKGKVKAVSPRLILLTEVVGRETMDALLQIDELAGFMAQRDTSK